MPYKNKQDKRDSDRIRVAARRAEFFADKKCKVCGSTKNLELDHRDPSEKVSHRIWSWSWKRIDEETAKCDILCHTHHKEKTARNKEHNRGTDVTISVLTDEIVKRGREMYATGKYTWPQLARELGVREPSTLRKACTKGWKHVK